MIARALPLLLLLGAAADEPLAGRAAGAPVNCIDLDVVQGPEIVDRSTILYRQNARRVWRTGPVGACPGLDRFATLIVEVYGKRLCRNDRFQPRPQGSRIPFGQCRFAPFTPYDRPARARSG